MDEVSCAELAHAKVATGAATRKLNLELAVPGAGGEGRPPFIGEQRGYDFGSINCRAQWHELPRNDASAPLAMWHGVLWAILRLIGVSQQRRRILATVVWCQVFPFLVLVPWPLRWRAMASKDAPSARSFRMVLMTRPSPTWSVTAMAESLAPYRSWPTWDGDGDLAGA
jgi:hypothetical protein